MLDFGAGTGFASQQIIEKLGHDRFESITLVEPSDEMARIGLDRLSAFGLPIERVESIPDTESEFEIVCVNSVLHHPPDPVAVINRLGALIARRGLFLVAQEPNVRYHSSLVGVVNRWARRIIGVMRPPGAPSSSNRRMLAVSDELVRRGITPVAMRPAEIGLVVGYWVPRPDHNERSTERLGFGVNAIGEVLGQRFTLTRAFTYDFLGKPRVLLPRLPRFLDFLVGIAFRKNGQQIAAVFQENGGDS